MTRSRFRKWRDRKWEETNRGILDFRNQDAMAYGLWSDRKAHMRQLYVSYQKKKTLGRKKSDARKHYLLRGIIV